MWQMKRKLGTLNTAAMTALQLDPKERQLKRLLLDTAAWIDKTREERRSSSPDGHASDATGEKLTLRWAGGWVRDKLLGRQSHDVDVAINSMTGEAFGEALKKFCKVPIVIEKHGLEKRDIGNIHTIAKNPEKSKNLATATVMIFGLDIDFVNLRTETYAADSRNPEVEFGTAEEDARRRDATVNALFYNIHTDEVEDFVGGLEDMQKKVMRTPLEPFQTFMDDPLRVLRLIRFASRLGFTIEPNAKEAMANEDVLQALRVKISRERVGQELEKMFKGEYALHFRAERYISNPYCCSQDSLLTCTTSGPHPRDAIRYIHELGLYHTVFADPTNPDFPKPDLTTWATTYEFLNTLPRYTLYEALMTSDEERYLGWLIACFVPYAQIPNQGDRTRNTKKNPPLITVAAREGLKCPGKISEFIAACWRNVEEIKQLKEVVHSGGELVNDRGYFGVAIRKWSLNGGKPWRVQVLFAMLDDVMKQTRDVADPAPVLAVIMADWQDFIDHVKKLDLMDAELIKPIVTGKEIAGKFKIKPGEWMMPVIAATMEWQLRNPEKTDPAEALEMLQSRKEELGFAHLLP